MLKKERKYNQISKKDTPKNSSFSEKIGVFHKKNLGKDIIYS